MSATSVLQKLSILFIVLYSFFGIASNFKLKVTQAKAVGNYSVGIGSLVHLEADDSPISGPAVFLGKAIMPDGTNSYLIFLSEIDYKIHYIDMSISQIKSTKISEMQPILNPYEQAGGTCTGYAINGYLQQLKLSGFTGTGILSDKLSTERGRTTLLVDNVNAYYLTPKHRYSIKGILNKYGSEFGFSCLTYKSDQYEKLRDRILDQLNIGQPMLISFNIGPKMYQTPFALNNYDNKKIQLDERLWIPRKIGERNQGGHSIVLAGSFEFQNKTYVMTIDSDWSEPRIWDLEAFLNTKTAHKEIELTSCKEKLK